jgi:hypothetical protein
MRDPLPVLLLLPPAGTSRAERWVAAGRLAAALDLVACLKQLADVGPIACLAEDAADSQALSSAGVMPLQSNVAPFHFGRVLAEFAAGHPGQGLAYFGGASAPLATTDLLDEIFAKARRTETPLAQVNNYFSTDWMVLSHAGTLAGRVDLLTGDNPLGWILEHEAGIRTLGLPPSGGTRADVDTPSDLLLLQGHPALGPAMSAFLSAAPKDSLAKVHTLKDALTTPGKTLGVIGRSSSHLWRELEKKGQFWVRLFVEERGMLASGRAGRGEVRSLVAELVDLIGPQAFVARLAEMTDAVLWDTRVWMAHRRIWPSAADRFAADLGWCDDVADAGLRELAQATAQAPIPVLCGGHGVVAGAVLALLESLVDDASYQP